MINNNIVGRIKVFSTSKLYPEQPTDNNDDDDTEYNDRC